MWDIVATIRKVCYLGTVEFVRTLGKEIKYEQVSHKWRQADAGCQSQTVAQVARLG